MRAASYYQERTAGRRRDALRPSLGGMVARAGALGLTDSLARGAFVLTVTTIDTTELQERLAVPGSTRP